MSNPAPFGQSPEASVQKPDATGTTAYNGLVDQWLKIQSNPTVQAIADSPLTQFAAYDAAAATGGAVLGAAGGGALGYGTGLFFAYPLSYLGTANASGKILSGVEFEGYVARTLASGVGRAFAWRGALAGAAVYGLYEAGKWAYNKITE